MLMLIWAILKSLITGQEKTIGGYQTATGVRSSNLYTVAVDPNVIPLGSKILIDGEEYLAVDVGGLVKGDHVDIFTETPIHKTYTAHVEIVR